MSRANARQLPPDPRLAPPLPPDIIQDRCDDIVTRQRTDLEKERMHRLIEKDGKQTVLAVRYYHHGSMGKFVRGGVYIIPKTLADRHAADYPSNAALVAIDEKAADARLKANKVEIAKRKRAIMDYVNQYVVGAMPQGAAPEEPEDIVL